MENPNEVEIKNIYRFIEEINKIIKNTKQGQLIFRGQGCHSNEVKSGAIRRLEKFGIPIHLRNLVDYHKILIENALKRCESHSIIKEKNELIILAELQHFGAATILIDFTFNSLTALFFACKSTSNISKVYCFHVDTPRFSQINTIQNDKYIIGNLKNSEKKEELFYEDYGFERIINNLVTKEYQTGNKKHFLKWLPPHNNNRIIKQDSVFIITSDGKINESEFDKILVIDKNSKDILLKELKLKFNLTDESIYPDFFGYAIANSTGKPFKFDKDNFSIGVEYYFKGDFVKAIEYLNLELKSIPENVKAYFTRGMSYYYKKEYFEAINDFTSFLEIGKTEDSSVYFYRGYSNSQMKKYTEAIKDYTKVIELEPNHFTALNNRGFDYILNGNLQNAESDLKRALELNSKYFLAKMNLSLVYILTNRYRDALDSVNDSLEEIIEINDFASAYTLKYVAEELLKKTNNSTKLLLKTYLLRLKIRKMQLNFSPDEMRKLVERNDCFTPENKEFIFNLLNEIKSYI
jgi:tetratricopeptide (TPR) repeat protein